MSGRGPDDYARHVRRFGDPRGVYEAACAAGLARNELLRLGRRLVKYDPGKYREGRRLVTWPRFTWAWAATFHVRRARLELIARGPLDCSQLRESELAALFARRDVSPSAAHEPPDSILVQIAAMRRGRIDGAGVSEDKSRLRLPVPALGERFGRLVVGRTVKRHDGRTWLLCSCDCGGATLAKPSHLRRGEVISCGCVRRERAAARPLAALPDARGRMKPAARPPQAYDAQPGAKR